MEPRSKSIRNTTSGSRGTGTNQAGKPATGPGKKKADLPVREAAKPTQTSDRQERSPQPTENEIAERAHSIWEREGHPHGRDREFWLQAETELKSERAPR